ncbi:MAG TPA: hypothetical protein VM187_05405 [Niastella sp.]|nr:hypothetical protein [Niastella sp.]
MKATNIIICLLLTFTNVSCSVNKWDVNRYKSKFEIHKKDFETLILLLKEQNLKVGYSVNENELPEKIQALLKELDISDVNLNTTQCQGLIDYQFTSSWSTKATLYFSKDACNKEQTAKGFHTIDRMIEVWGIGDGWTMWIDHDFI